MIKRLSKWCGIPLLNLNRERHCLKDVVHDPLVVVLRIKLSHLFLFGVIVVDDLFALLHNIGEGCLKLVDAEL